MSLPIYEQIDLKKHGFVEASAGTGKTYTIEHLVLKILKSKNKSEYQKLENILIVTFTEKATGELKERIRKTIELELERLNKEEPKEGQALIEHLNYCLNHFNESSIQTIHGFCNTLLQNFPFQCNQPFDAEGCSDAEIIPDIVSSLLNQWKYPLSETFFSPDRPLPASLQKTFSHWREFFSNTIQTYVPHQGDNLGPVLPKDFSEEKSCKHLSNLLHQAITLLKYAGEEAVSHPFHTSYQELKSNLKINGTTASSISKKILSPWLQLLESTLASPTQQTLKHCSDFFDNLSYGKFKESQTFFFMVQDLNIKEGQEEVITQWSKLSGLPIHKILTLMDQIHHAYLSHQYNINIVPFYEQLIQYIKEGRQALDKHKEFKHLFSFQDMLVQVHKALYQGSLGLCSLLQKKYTYGIIDEFQDTNKLQWEIFKKIFLDSPTKNILYLIGDPKQSIFSFQGSDVQTYIQATSEITKHNGLSYPANRNYRSTKEMIHAYNSLFSQSAWFGESNSSIHYENVLAGKKEGFDPRLLSLSQKPIIVHDLSTIKTVPEKRSTHAEWICKNINQLIQESEQSISHGDMAILVQTNAETAILAKKLGSHGIPYIRYKETGLLQTEEARHFIALLEAIHSPHNIQKQHLGAFSHFFKIEPENILSPEATHRSPPPIELFEKWKTLATANLWSQLFHSVFTETGILHRQNFFADHERKISLYLQLKSYAHQIVIDDNLNLSQLIQRLKRYHLGEVHAEEGINRINRESDKKAVQILTMHSSKGLEFPIVFIMGGTVSSSSPKTDFLSLFQKEGGRKVWIDKADPQSKAQALSQAIAEKKRLYYVALTRAEYRLYLPLFYSADDIKKKNEKSVLHSAPYFMSSAILNSLNKNKNNLITIDTSSPMEEGTEASPAPGSPSQNFVSDCLNKLLQKKDTLLQLKTENQQLHVKHRTHVQTSYSSLAHNRSSSYTMEGRANKEEDVIEEFQPVESIQPLRPADLLNQSEPPTSLEKHSQYQLPGGAETGTALHEVLERISFESVGTYASPEELYQSKDCPFIWDIIEKYHIKKNYLSEVCEIIWNTLHTPLPDPSHPGSFIQLYQVKDIIAEMEFHFAFNAQGEMFPSHDIAGYVIGYIDLIFRLNDLYYIVDWKSNYLNSYNPSEVWASMEKEQYTTQSLLYSVAMHKWLENTLPHYSVEKNFGGIFYLYLRGIQPQTTDGINGYKPSPQDLNQNFPKEVQQLIRSSGLHSIKGLS